tara:strand:+ start:1137 stop:1277 length:141 start_codon:yes stop_codon:yes gene_type:complete
MPTVGKKKFPYTRAGMKAANAASKRQGKKVAKATKPKRGTKKTSYA